MDGFLVFLALAVLAIPVAVAVLLVGQSRLKTRMRALEQQVALWQVSPSTPVTEPVTAPVTEVPQAAPAMAAVVTATEPAEIPIGVPMATTPVATTPVDPPSETLSPPAPI